VYVLLAILDINCNQVHALLAPAFNTTWMEHVSHVQHHVLDVKLMQLLALLVKMDIIFQQINVYNVLHHA
jgi:hypothetical protein